MNLPSSVLDPPSHHTLHANHDPEPHSTHESVHASHLESSPPRPRHRRMARFCGLSSATPSASCSPLLLLLPSLNAVLGEWTYGRWMMVHVNILLYGWCSLPMLGWLFRIYGADRGPPARWCRPVLWAWSTALVHRMRSRGSPVTPAASSFSTGPAMPRIAFPVAMLALWLLLAGLTGSCLEFRAKQTMVSPRCAKIIGLAILLAVPFAIYIASSPGLYPAINPVTGGPTGESQLESSLGVVAILLIVPFGVARRKSRPPLASRVSAIVFAAEVAIVSIHEPRRRQPSHALAIPQPRQPARLASARTRILCNLSSGTTIRAAGALLFSGGGDSSLLSGWIMFLPGVLDHFKFTDGLVGHSLVAVAGFLTALLAVVMVQLLGEDGWILTRRWSFHMWNWSVLAYVVVMLIAGWHEGSDPAFTIVPGLARNILVRPSPCHRHSHAHLLRRVARRMRQRCLREPRLSFLLNAPMR